MSNLESAYLAKCKELIEEKFYFENGNGSLRQRDLEHLADAIEEKSGIKLSLSTLKRLWKKDYDQTPHPSTLQALVSVLGYKDWQEFKLQNPSSSSSSIIHKKKHRKFFNLLMLLIVLIIFTVLFWLIAFRPFHHKADVIVNGPVTFTGNKTVAQGVPSTIIFNYDVSNVAADSFFFQQSWDKKEKVKIDPKEHYYSNVYYYPGSHIAKLIANDSVIKSFNVNITTNGWLPLIRRYPEDSMPLYIKKNFPIINGAMHITSNDLDSLHFNTKDFILSYFNVRDFENTFSDNFSLDTRVICDSNNASPCPSFELTIIFEGHIFYVDLAGKGCEGNIGIKMGEVALEGTYSDLSMFGRDLYKWQRLQIRVVNKHATIYLDEQPVYSINFKNDFGKIEGLNFNFSGTGAVDYIKLKNEDNTIVYEDDFDK